GSCVYCATDLKRRHSCESSDPECRYACSGTVIAGSSAACDTTRFALARVSLLPRGASAIHARITAAARVRAGDGRTSRGAAGLGTAASPGTAIPMTSAGAITEAADDGRRTYDHATI